MKRIILNLLVTSLLTLNLVNASAAAQSACPELRVRITSVEIIPQQPAQQHIVKVAWGSSAPPCYTINKFHLRGTITFANGQTKSFAQSAAGNQTSVQIQVAGLATNTTPSLATPGMIPRSVNVSVTAEASASIAGVAGNLNTTAPSEGDVVSAAPTSCLPLVQIQNVQAVFAGLVRFLVNTAIFIVVIDWCAFGASNASGRMILKARVQCRSRADTMEKTAI